MPFSVEPYAPKKFMEILGKRMAYIDVGEGDAIVFQHGNPTSSYLWRNVMPHCEGLGRLVACDLIGMGDSDKLTPSGPDSYSFVEHRRYLHALWDALALGERVVLVLHDWGSALGFDWARQHSGRVQAIAYMESIVKPLDWEIAPGESAKIFRAIRSPAGEQLMLEQNMFVERMLPGSILRTMNGEELDAYRKPFRNPGEDRRPTLSWPRQIPIEGEPADVAAIVRDYSQWLTRTECPKLFINADPGMLLTGSSRDFCRKWRNQTEVTVKGLHFIQEDSPDEIGAALSQFVRRVRKQARKQITP